MKKDYQNLAFESNISSDQLKHKMMDKALQGYINSSAFPCFSHSGSYSQHSMEIFSTMGTAHSAMQMWSKINNYLDNIPVENIGFSFTHFIIFDETEIKSEAHFQNLQFRQLSQAPGEGVNRLTFEERFLQSPNDPDFKIDIGPFRIWILGMHPKSKSKNRRFPWPMLIFHPEPRLED